KEVLPAENCLAQDHARLYHVEAPQNGDAPVDGERHAGEDADDDAAVHREAAFPDSGDLPRIEAVVVPVECALVEPPPHEPRDDRPLRHAQDLVGWEPLLLGLSMS